MSTSTKKLDREKVNFMVNKKTMADLKVYIPQGGRSDFVNQVLEGALITLKRKKAFESIDKLRKKMNLHISMDEFRKLRAYGRE